jgi:O-antigen/teichoic acid export membrane protein
MTSAPPRPETAAGAPPLERPLGGLLKHSAIYSAAPVLRQVLSVGMSRFYTAWLGTAGAGVKENADLWGIALQQVLGQNVLGAMVRFYYDQKDARARAAVVTSCTLLILLVAFALCGVALVFVPWLTPLLLGRGGEVPASELGRVCVLLLLLVPFQLATVSGNYYLFALKRSRTYTAIQTAKLLFEIGMNVWLMGTLGLGVTGFLLSMLAGEILTSAGLVGWMMVRLKPRIDRELLRPILRYALPLVPVGLLQLLLHQGDRRIVLELLGQDAAGVYGFGYRIAMLVTNMVLGPFIVTWQPFIFGIEDKAERARLVARVGTYAVLSIAVASLGVILFGRQAALLLAGDPEFHAAYRVVPFVATGYVFWALYNVSQTPLFLDKRTGRLVLVNLCAVLLSLALNAWVLVPHLEILGAALASLTTFAVLAALGMFASRRSAGVRFELGRLTAILACVVLGGVFALWIDALEVTDELGHLSAVGVKAAALVALVLLLWARVLHADERARFRAWLAARLGRT